MDNDRATSDLKSPVFDMESERFELDTNVAKTRSSCVDDCCLDDIFNSAGSDASEDESTEFHHNDQEFDTMELNYNTMTCVIDVKGIVKSCVPIENHKIIDRKLELLANDIETIENRLRSFLGDHFLYYDFDTRDQILLLIDLIKKDISRLDDYWNGHYLVTEELNRQINELNHSNTDLCHMNQEVADLYSVYVDTKFRLQCMITYRKNELVSFDKAEAFLMELINWTPSNGPNSESVMSDSENVPSDYESVASDSESVASDSESVKSDSESIKSDSESVKSDYESVKSDSECVVSDSKSVKSDSESVKSDSCSDRRSEFCIDDDKSDDCESFFNCVETDVAAEETIVETHPLDDNARFRRMEWIMTIFMILWLAGWLGPQCCDIYNYYKCLFEYGVRCINGTPPT